MFSLIITIVSIALVIAITLAALYFGGSEALDKGQDEAHAAQAVNEMNQIHNAIFSHQAMKGHYPENLDNLLDAGFIRTVPQGWETEDEGRVGVRPINIRDNDAHSERVCKLINERLGYEDFETIPSCSSVVDQFKGCCESL